MAKCPGQSKINHDIRARGTGWDYVISGHAYIPDGARLIPGFLHGLVTAGLGESSKCFLEGSSCRPSACETDVIAIRQQVLIDTSSLVRQRLQRKAPEILSCPSLLSADAGLMVVEYSEKSSAMEQLAESFTCCRLSARPGTSS